VILFVWLVHDSGDWRKLHTDELHYSYTVPDIVRVLKSRTLRVVGCVACMGDLNNETFGRRIPVRRQWNFE
jgi:hypothetical protein